VFDYTQRREFWSYIIGHVPATEPRIHRFDDVEQVTVEDEDRKKIQDYYRLDMDTWADQFKWR
jgi:hypothetical protein